MALAEILKSYVVEPTAVSYSYCATDDWPEDIQPCEAVPDFLAGALNAWYGVDYMKIFEGCFISTPSLTTLFDDAIDAFADGNYELFL